MNSASHVLQFALLTLSVTYLEVSKDHFYDHFAPSKSNSNISYFGDLDPIAIS